MNDATADATKQVNPDGAAPFLRLFGVPVLEKPSGPPLVFLPQRPFQVLAYLACQAQWVARDALATWLWPQDDPGAARKNLRKVLTQARALVGTAGAGEPGSSAGALEAQGDVVRWLVDHDLARFDADCSAHRADAVLSALHAPLMHGLETGLSPVASQWLAGERLRVLRHWRDFAIERLGQSQDLEERTALCERMLALDPFDDDAMLHLARALAARGRRAEAAARLDAYIARLHDEFGVVPNAALAAERAAIAVAGAAGPGIKSKAEPPSAPPPLNEGFVGRRSELAQLTGLLMDPDCRVLTISGPGGIGKSRLAAHAAVALAERFQHRIHVVATADLNSASELAQRLTAQLNVEGEDDLWRAVAHAVSDRDMLWVLDSTEHLGDLAQPLSALLERSPRLKVINTSRARLGIKGEWMLPLEGFPVPDADETDVDVLRSYDGVRFFEARARMALPSFRLEDHAASVVALLALVDGLPLAVELATPWVRLLPVAEIVREIRDSPDLLGEAPRQIGSRGLRDSFAHSWRLLAAEERIALARTAVLPDDFDRDMARQVADATLAQLAVLVSASLLQTRPGGRFGLHPMIKAYALEQAKAAALGDEIQRRHAAWVARWMESIAADNADTRWAELARGFTHARSAWHWAVRERDADTIARAARGLMLLCESRGWHSEGLALMRGAVGVLNEDDANEAVALSPVLRCLATLQYRAGQLDDAEASARRGLRLARRLGDSTNTKGSLNLLGLSVWLGGRFAEARPYFREALRLAERDSDAAGERKFQSNLAMVETSLGNYAEAAMLYQQRLDLERDPNLLNNAANALRALGKHETAAALLAEALAFCQQHGLESIRTFVLVNLGILDLDRGRLDAARARFERALESPGARGEPPIAIEVRLWMAMLELERGHGVPAAVHLFESLALVRTMRSRALELRWLAVFVRWCVERQRIDDAAAVLQWVDAQPGLSALDRDDALRRLTPGQLQALAAPVTPRFAGHVQDPLSWASEQLAAATRDGASGAPHLG